MLPGSILGATRAQLPELRNVKSTLASQHLLCSSSVSGFLLFCLPVSRRRAEQELKAGGGQGLAGCGAPVPWEGAASRSPGLLLLSRAMRSVQTAFGKSHAGAAHRVR